MSASYQGSDILAPLASQFEWQFLHRIDSIDLSGLQVKDEHLDRLSDLHSLKKLRITSTSISQEALDRFAKKRPDCELTVVNVKTAFTPLLVTPPVAAGSAQGEDT